MTRDAWTVAVGNINPLKKASRRAVQFIKTLDGLLGVFPVYPKGTLLLFESENAAKIAKNMLEAKGILTGDNICKCQVDI